MALQYHGIDGSYILANMERLANDGWCVVLKKLPPGFPWIIPDDPSEYAGPSEAQAIGTGKWCCEATDVRREGPYRHSQWAMHETPAKAVRSVFLSCNEETQRAGKLRHETATSELTDSTVNKSNGGEH